MSRQGFLEKLLDGAAVEWKSVAEIFHVKNGYTPSKSKKEYWENGTIPWFRMDDIRANGQVLSQSIQNITKSAVKAGKLFPANSMIFATSATIGEHALVTVPYLANQRFTNLTLKDEYTEIFNCKFLFYYGFLLAEWCKKNTTKSSFASVDMDGFRKFPIPIPCPEDPKKSLSIQADIVRILETFAGPNAGLTAALNVELEARKKQYSYYRDQLLGFEGRDVAWRTLDEIGEFIRGKRFTKADYVDQGIPVIHYGEIYTGNPPRK